MSRLKKDDAIVLKWKNGYECRYVIRSVEKNGYVISKEHDLGHKYMVSFREVGDAANRARKEKVDWEDVTCKRCLARKETWKDELDNEMQMEEYGRHL